jgi:peptidoglycan/LPS O-acetylase OafA/YrhL
LLYFMAGVWLASISEMLSHRRYLRSLKREPAPPPSGGQVRGAIGAAVIQFFPDLLCVGGGILLSGPNLDAHKVIAFDAYTQFVTVPWIMLIYIGFSIYAVGRSRMCLSRLLLESVPMNLLGYCSYPVYLYQNIVLLYYLSYVFRGEDGEHYEASHIDRGSFQALPLWERAVGVLIVLVFSLLIQVVIQDKFVGGFLAKKILTIPINSGE